MMSKAGNMTPILGAKARVVTRETRLVWVVSVAVAGIYLSAAVIRLETGRATEWDFGYFSQVLWLIAHGHWAAKSTLNGHLALTDAGSAILYPIGLLYPGLGSVGILAIQAAAVASGLPFLHWWLNRTRCPEVLRWVVLGAYVVYPAVLGPALFDWHPDALAIPAAFYALWAIEERKPWHYWLAVLLLLSTKVTSGFVVAGLAVPWLMRREWWIGISTVLVGISAAFGEVDWLFPLMTGHTMPQWTHYYGWLGPTPVSGLKFLLSHPGAVIHVLSSANRIIYLAVLLAPIGIVPTVRSLAHGGWAYPAWIIMGFNLLSSFGGQQNPYNQYSAVVTPFVFVSLVVWLPRLRIRTQSLAAIALTCASLSMVLWFFMVERPVLWEPNPPTAALAEASRYVPAKAPLYGQDATLTRLSDRRLVHMLPLPRGASPGTVVILTTDVNPLTTASARAIVDRTLSRLSHHPQHWKRIFDRGNVWVFRRR